MSNHVSVVRQGSKSKTVTPHFLRSRDASWSRGRVQPIQAGPVPQDPTACGRPGIRRGLFQPPEGGVLGPGLHPGHNVNVPPMSATGERMPPKWLWKLIRALQPSVNRRVRLEFQVLLRKEVIQPHLPVRLPCYDLVLITDPTFDSSLLAVGPLASGVTDFHDLTGGVYKARERIHRSVADLRLLATPTS